MGESQPQHKEFMERALTLAACGIGLCSPNPVVGCVVVKDGRIVGEGWHKGPGEPHAEVEALRDAGAAAKGATLFVTLEPCNHFGRTPPCVDAIIKAGVSAVYYAIDDPNPQAAGGASSLREQGITVVGGLCAPAASDLNRVWLHAVKNTRPYIFAKFAASLDGRIATADGQSKWLTGPAARRRAHELRQRCDAILAGAQTIVADDPSLTVRLDDQPARNPLRIVIDPSARTSAGSKVYQRDDAGAMIVIGENHPPQTGDRYRAFGVDVLECKTNRYGQLDLHHLLESLHQRGIQSVMVEGGGKTLGAFLEAGLIDEVWGFIAPIVLGANALPIFATENPISLHDALTLHDPVTEQLGPDTLIRGRIKSETA